MLAQLTTALNSAVAAFVIACATPKPNYSIDGQSVSYGDYLRMLTEAIKATLDLITMIDPVESRSVIL